MIIKPNPLVLFNLLALEAICPTEIAGVSSIKKGRLNISFCVATSFENISFANMKLEWFEIIYCGIVSTGVAYTIQIVAQGKASPAPAAIILSMESVFAAIAGWIIMNQYLDNYKLVGCCCILLGVILVQLIPLYVRKQKNL